MFFLEHMFISGNSLPTRLLCGSRPKVSAAQFWLFAIDDFFISHSSVKDDKARPCQYPCMQPPISKHLVMLLSYIQYKAVPSTEDTKMSKI